MPKIYCIYCKKMTERNYVGECVECKNKNNYNRS